MYKNKRLFLKLVFTILRSSGSLPLSNFKLGIIFLNSGTLINAASRPQVLPGLALLLLIFARLRKFLKIANLKTREKKVFAKI